MGTSTRAASTWITRCRASAYAADRRAKKKNSKNSGPLLQEYSGGEPRPVRVPLVVDASGALVVHTWVWSWGSGWNRPARMRCVERAWHSPCHHSGHGAHASAHCQEHHRVETFNHPAMDAKPPSWHPAHNADTAPAVSSRESVATSPSRWRLALPPREGRSASCEAYNGLLPRAPPAATKPQPRRAIGPA